MSKSNKRSHKKKVEFPLNTCVYIGPYKVSVEIVSHLSDELLGCYDSKKKKISVEGNINSVGGIDIGRTLFHEILHGHSFIYGHSWNKESLVNAIDSLYLTLFDPRNAHIIDLFRLSMEDECKKK